MTYLSNNRGRNYLDTDRQTDIILTERKSIQTYLS